jgi:hypothetical protein
MIDYAHLTRKTEYGYLRKERFDWRLFGESLVVVLFIINLVLYLWLLA